MAGGVRGAGAKPPSQEAYFVALGGILVLLLLLCCYFFYFCIKRVKELNAEMREESATQPVRPAPAGQYAVRPAVRDGATALARLCRQLPAGPSAGRAVFPAASSPAAARAAHSPRAASPDSAAAAPPAATPDPVAAAATPAAVKPPPTATAPPPVADVQAR